MRYLVLLSALALFVSCEKEEILDDQMPDAEFGELVVMPEPDGPDTEQLGIGRFYSTENRWTSAGWTKVGDFNGDGRDDLASLYYNQVILKLSNGLNVNYTDNEVWFTDGSYAPASWTFSGDFNGDGYADIVSLSGNRALMKLNTRNDGFNSVVWSVSNQWGGSGYTVVGDFDGDGDDDIASAYGNRIFLKRSFRSGFSSHTYYTSGEYGGSGWTFACDYNGDGRDDIVSLSGGNIYIKQSKVNSSGVFSGFTAYTHYTSNVWGGSTFTWAGDSDGDGREEILTAIGDKIYVREWNGSNNWNRSTRFTNNWWGGSTGYNWSMDYTGDGSSEVVSARGGQLLLH